MARENRGKLIAAKRVYFCANKVPLWTIRISLEDDYYSGQEHYVSVQIAESPNSRFHK